MITETTLYGIRCDECGDYFYYQKWGMENFSTKEAAEDYADEEGWTIKDGKHICPDCYFKIHGEEEEVLQIQ